MKSNLPNLPEDLQAVLPLLSNATVMATVRRKGCRCRLAVVRRVKGRDVLATTARTVLTNQAGGKEHLDEHDLDWLDGTRVALLAASLGCEHGSEVARNTALASIRQHVASVACGETPAARVLML